jgi:hypothetical protein
MDPFTATMLFFMWLALSGDHHHPHADGHPKHDTCCGYRGCRGHQHYSGRACGLPWEYDH